MNTQITSIGNIMTLINILIYWKRICSIARNTAECDNSFVTAGEDRTVRYWKDGINTETFQLPAQSVWTVACFSNGDIITGSR